MRGEISGMTGGDGMMSCKHLLREVLLQSLIQSRPFYKKTENFTEPESDSAQLNKLYYDRESIGKDGPVSICYIKEYSSSHQHWHGTLNNLGIETNEAHLSGSNVGAWTSFCAVDPKRASRAWSASSYYVPNANRSNLHVLTGATVRHIVLQHEGNDLVAKGACFDHLDGRYVVSAAKEVILSAGSVASPQILELSGIGSPAVLKQAGIEVKVENENVGNNLQDHISKLMSRTPRIPVRSTEQPQ